MRYKLESSKASIVFDSTDAYIKNMDSFNHIYKFWVTIFLILNIKGKICYLIEKW